MAQASGEEHSLGSQLLENKIAEDALEAVVPEHDDGKPRYLLNSLQNKAEDSIKVGLGRGHMSGVDVSGLEPRKEQLARGNVIPTEWNAMGQGQKRWYLRVRTLHEDWHLQGSQGVERLFT